MSSLSRLTKSVLQYQSRFFMLWLVNGLLDREYFQFVSARTMESSVTMVAPCASDMVLSVPSSSIHVRYLQCCQSPAKQIGWCVVSIVGLLSVGWILLCLGWAPMAKRDHGHGVAGGAIHWPGSPPRLSSLQTL